MFGRMFNKLTTLSIIFLLISIIAVPQLSIAKTEINNSCITLYVGGTGYGNYTKIQEAVDNATFGDIIYISNGTYYENIIVDESIKLIGENKTNTIIDGGKGEENKTILKVTAENVKISGFTIQNAKGIGGRAGLILNKNGNRFTRNNIFTDNIVKNCSYGVMVVNPINNIVTNNSLYGCGIGPYLTYPIYFDNQFVNNTVNDKPILLYENEENLIIDGVETDCVSLIKCKNVEIRNLNISDITVGIELSYCTKIKVINNIVSNTGRGGIYVHHSDHCTFKYNTFISDNWGIFLRKSNFNKIHYNNFINVTMPDWFASSYFNSWDSNYWGESISGPREIFGKIGFFEKIPWYNFDQNPADEPNSLYASEKTIYVDDDGSADYTKIQDAIDDASDSDTVFVYNGTYYENLVVNKKIDLIGEDKHTTIVDGMMKGDTITINVEGVTLSNFTIMCGVTDIKNDICRAGIRVTRSNNNIKNNIIKNNKLGIFGLRVTNLTICNNQFYDDGITFSPYENEARPRIFMEYFLHDIYNNTVNDKPLYYYKNQKDFTVPKDAGMVILTNCTNVIITDANLTHSDNGLLMAYSSSCLIEHSNISNSDGIWIFCSNQNIFQFNNLSNNFHGITLDYYSNGNLITNNIILNNQMAGVMIEYHSINNHITKNNLINNTYGGYFTQAFINKWDQNYYSDWIGLKYNKMTCLPKIILGRSLDLYPTISICFKIDWHPAETPYN